jgi:hypothetical protein
MHNYNDWEPTVNLRIGVAVLVIAWAALLIGAFISMPDRRAETTFTAAVTAAGAALYSAYHVGVALRINLYRDKQKRAYEVLDQLNRVDSISVRLIVEAVMRDKLDSDTAYRVIVGDKQKEESVRMLLGMFEDMAYAIRTGYAHEDVLFAALQVVAAFYYDGLKAYIDGLREARNNDDFYSDFEQLAGAWRQHKSYRTGKSMRA